MSNLKVHDSEHENFAATIKRAGEVAEEQVELYFSILSAVLESAITAGVIYENLTLFQSQAQAVKGSIGELCNVVNADDSAYVAEINKEDEYLY